MSIFRKIVPYLVLAFSLWVFLGAQGNYYEALVMACGDSLTCPSLGNAPLYLGISNVVAAVALGMLAHWFQNQTE